MEGRRWEGGREREGRGNFPIASVGSLAGGDNRKRAHIACTTPPQNVHKSVQYSLKK